MHAPSSPNNRNKNSAEQPKPVWGAANKRNSVVSKPKDPMVFESVDYTRRTVKNRPSLPITPKAQTAFDS